MAIVARKYIALMLTVLLLAGLVCNPACLKGAGAEELPDLAAGNIVTSDELILDQEASVKVGVINSGAAPAGSFTVTLYAGADQVGAKNVDSLDSGASVEVEFAWTPSTPGEVTLRAVLDEAGSLDESAEDNNEKSKTVTVAEPAAPGGEDLPDLVAEDIVTPAEIVSGQEAAVKVGVSNGGEAAGENFTVTLYAGSDLVGAPQTMGSLEPGASMEVEFSWTPTSPGEVILRAVLDEAGSLDESAEDNNEKSKTVTVAEPAAPGGEELPDLIAGDIVTPAEIVSGQEAAVKVGVSNGGEAAGENFTVTLYAGSGLVGASQTVGSLEPGASMEVEFSWTPTSPGEVTLRAVLDEAETLEESTEDNNEKSKTVTVAESAAPGGEELPDLVAGNIVTPAEIVSGQAAAAKVGVSNGGEVAVENFTVTLYAGSDPVGASQTVGSLEPGASVEVEFSWTPSTPGEVILKAVLDESGGLEESSEENNEISKTVTVAAAAGPLAVVGTSPAQGAMTDPAGEFSITFNKPVAIDQDLASELTLYCNQSTYTTGTLYGKLYVPAYNLRMGDYDGVLAVDPDDPCRVLVNINSHLNNNRAYAVVLQPGAIKSLDGEISDFSNPPANNLITSLWQFNTGPVPNSVEIVGLPVDATAGEKYKLAAIVKEKNGNTIKDFPVALTPAPGDSSVAVVDGGLLNCLGNGSVTIMIATNDGYYSKNKSYNIKVRDKLPLKLSTRWIYEIPLEYVAAKQGIPVVSIDGTVYLMIAYKGLGEISGSSAIYKLRALGPDGKPKADFQEQVITKPPVVAELNGEEYILTARDNTFLALDPATGAVRWQRDLPSGIWTSAVVGRNGSVFVGCSDYRLYCLCQEVEGYRWRFDAEDKIMSAVGEDYNAATPTVDDLGNVYLVTGRTLKVVDGESGAMLWQFTIPDQKDIQQQAAVGPDGTVYISSAEFNKNGTGGIYALTPPTDPGGNPSIRWSMTGIYNIPTTGQKPLLDPEGNVYFSIIKTSGAASVLAKFDPAGNGSGGPLILREMAGVYSNYALLGPGGGIITSNISFGPEDQPLAYNDIYYGNLPYFSYSRFSLGPDGAIYRFWNSEGRVTAVEAAQLYDPSGSTPDVIRLAESSLAMYSGQSQRIYPLVLDQNGVVMNSEPLEWSSSDETLLTVEDGLLTAAAGKTGTAQINVKVISAPSIAADFTVEVKSTPVIDKMYFIRDGVRVATEAEAAPYLVGRISGPCGEWLDPAVTVFVQDQHGNLVADEPVTIQLADSEIADMLTEVGLGKGVKYGAVLTGAKEGVTTLTATLQNHPEITCMVPVEVRPADYNLLWTVPLDGPWSKKTAWHAEGTEEIFYVNVNELRAVVKEDGRTLWSADLGDRYGIVLGKPSVGPDGTVYVYGTTTAAVLAVDPGDGSVRWKFTAGGGGIKEIKITPDAVYALTLSGSLHKIGTDGESLWGAPLELGADNGGMALSPEGELYVSRQGSVFKVAEDGGESKIYEGPGGQSLALKAACPGGDIILQRSGDHALVSLSPEGSENWIYSAISGEVEVSCGGDGGVYALTPLIGDGSDSMEINFYVLDSGGGLMSSGLLYSGRPRLVKDSALFRPLPGQNGVVYFYAEKIYTVDASSGRILRTIALKDQYSTNDPDTLSVDGNGVMYGTFGTLGMVAIAEKAYFGDGIELAVSGRERVRPGSLAEIGVRLKNELSGAETVLLTLSLTAAGEGPEPGSTSLEALLEPGQEREFTLGIRIPAGAAGFKVTVSDPDTGSIYGSYSQPLGG